MIRRDAITRVLSEKLQPLDYVYALWEGGATGFDRIDEWSDLDLRADVEDGRACDVNRVVKEALTSLSPVEITYQVPQPTWHGHMQTFYRLKNASKFLVIDFVVMEHSCPNKYLELELHGPMKVYFDKAGVVKSTHLDVNAWATEINDRLVQLRQTFELFQVETIKELNRGNAIDALTYYHNAILNPLVEVLRMKYKPEHYSYFTRYTYYDFPAEVVGRLEPLFFVLGAEDMRRKHAEAVEWFNQAVLEFNMENLRAYLQKVITHGA
jgi:hypothetical protein